MLAIRPPHLRQRHRRAGRLHHRLRQRHARDLRAAVPIHHAVRHPVGDDRPAARAAAHAAVRAAEKEGRLRDEFETCDNTRRGHQRRPQTDALRGDGGALSRSSTGALLTDAAIATRINNKMRYMSARSTRRLQARGELCASSGACVTRGILPGGPSRWWAFLRTVPLRRPRQVPMVVSDWIIGYRWRTLCAANSRRR